MQSKNGSSGSCRLTRRDLLGAGLALAGAGSIAAQGEGATERRVTDGRTRFAVNVEMWWRDRPFLERLDAAAEHGFQAVEFWGLGGKDVDAIASRCRDLGLAVAQFTAWGFTPGLNDPLNHGAFVEAIETACDVAKRLGAEHATVAGGNDIEGMSPADMHANITRGLKRVVPLVEREGLTLILEPMNIRVDHAGHCLYGSEDAIRICREVDSPRIKINWDLYHMQISEGDLCGRLRDGFDQVGYLQLADHPGRHEPGTGEIHYPRVLREAWELGYRGYVGLECSPAGDEAAATRAVALADRW